jgi:glyoxylase-like metal-dependent hydrolase (beta-lactamase superfamily II)
MTDAQVLFPGIYFIPGATNTGAVCAESNGTRDVYLIDSGGSPEEGERIYSVLCSLFGKSGFVLRAVINTHSHADHTGGNAFLRKKTGCGVWMSYREKGGMENTVLQSAIAWGGRPLPEFETPFYVPDSCETTRVISEKDVIPLPDGKIISFIPLPGHYFEMLGVVCTSKEGKRVVFTGDGVLGRKAIGKFSIPFMYDVGAFMDSLDALCGTDADWFIPSHGDAVPQITETAEMNKIAVLETITGIMQLLAEKPLSAEELLTAVADKNSIPMRLAQYVLIGSTLRSYLSYLYRTERITYKIIDNKMLWSVKK